MNENENENDVQMICQHLKFSQFEQTTTINENDNDNKTKNGRENQKLIHKQFEGPKLTTEKKIELKFDVIDNDDSINETTILKKKNDNVLIETNVKKIFLKSNFF